MKATSLDEFYQQTATIADTSLDTLLPDGIRKEVGYFNVFDQKDLLKDTREKTVMPYDRRAYYKISLINGRNRAEYADKVIDIAQNALLFATPKVPYNWVPQDQNQSGHFCIFTEPFLIQAKSGVVLDDLPIFKAGGYPIFQVSDEECADIRFIFAKMHKEIASDYAYKYDLLRNYVLELIHFGQKLQPVAALHPAHSASARVTSLFVELLERQFPIETPQQQLRLRTAKDYADRLAIHTPAERWGAHRQHLYGTGPLQPAYAAMKGAVEVLTRYLAKELGPRGIAVNTVAPGAIETDFGGGVVRDNPDANRGVASQTALGRVGLPEDIGGVVAFLCSNDGRWVNAQRLEVSGGIYL